MKSSIKKEMTVIIPFLNENKEVRNTVKNLRENSNQEFDIILINDGSTDGYDYKQVAIDYEASYIEHPVRYGVPASKDEGVNLCITKYFLILDAHMRVYQDDWVEILVDELKKNNKSLLCAATINIDFKGDIKDKQELGYGAYYTFPDLNLKWITSKYISDEDSGFIPCVLGASYACSKEYWQYLEGMVGLKSYGSEEQLISIKVWLDGGICRLIKNVKFGHIFRAGSPVPYEARPKDFYKNILYIAELFYDFDMKIRLLQNLQIKCGANFISDIMAELIQQSDFILNRKKYYKSIFTQNMKYIIDLNQPYLTQNRNKEKKIKNPFS